MTSGRDAAMLLSHAIEEHFMAFWLTGLVLAVWWAFARRSAFPLPAPIPSRTRRVTMTGRPSITYGIAVA